MSSTGQPGTFFMPAQASTFAASVDGLYYFIFWLCVAFFFVIMGLMAYFVVSYRKRPGAPKVKQISHNTPLEVAWSVIPLLLVVVIFMWGFRGFMEMRVIPRNAYQVNVTARKWSWSFEHPNGLKEMGELHVPVDTPVKLIMTSEDVIHSFFVPTFRIKQDVVPGRYTTQWFQSNSTGPQQVFCTEYCGKDHSVMYAKVIVQGQKEFEKFLIDAEKDDRPLTEVGQSVYQKSGCMGCHSIDGTAVVGPTFKGLFGRQENITGGTTVAVDENYLRESILEPQAKVVAGFQPVMPTFKGVLSDRQVDGLIEYIKTIK